MSEMVHYKGKLKATGKSVKLFLSQAKKPENYIKEEEVDGSYLNFIFDVISVNDTVFNIERELVESDGNETDLFIAQRIDSDNIEFEVRFYNGGCGFYEALEESILNIKELQN